VEHRSDTGGAGRWRGGCTTRRAYRVLYEEATCTVIAERGRVAPAGVLGGEAGTCFTSTVERGDGRREILPAKGKQAVLAAGDLVTIQPAGAGGYGSPLERPVDLVLEDVVNGYVTAGAAEASYGVVLAKDGRSVDAAATARRRAKSGA